MYEAVCHRGGGSEKEKSVVRKRSTSSGEEKKLNKDMLKTSFRLD